MSRLFPALLAASTLLLAAQARAQSAEAKPPAAATGAPAPSAPAPTAPRGTPAAPSLGAPRAAGAAGAELDPALRDVVRREVEKAKEEMRDEMRAEIQGAQAAREFMETSAAGDRPKLEFLQLNGYLRVRGDLFDNLDLRRTADPSGFFLYPRPLRDPDHRGTLTSANIRFRLEPTLNVSEQVRVLSQVDLLDDLVLGSTPQGLYTGSDGILQPFDSRTQGAPGSSITVKRAWAEVQTPLGLLSFGRMPSSWGLGVLSHAGNGLDDDLGDTVDRLQFALTPLKTAVGQLVLVPMYEIVSTGVTTIDQRFTRGVGQPFDLDPSDDAKAVGLKVARIDTDEELRRKLERGDASVSFGAWYMYKSQGYEFPRFSNATSATTDTAGPSVRRDAYAHTLDLWSRYQTKRFRFEVELAGILGQIGDAAVDVTGAALGPVLLRQLGGAAQADWSLAGGKFHLGGEAGFASGDRNPGFGNRPARGCTTAAGTGATTCAVPKAGDIDGAQFAPGDRVQDIRNFRFNPAYRVDLILWREILQGVTDAFYLKPTARYEFIEGLAATASIVYSQAMYAGSTPSTTSRPLGIELDLGLTYHSEDGFVAFVNYGLLQPLDGLGYPPGGSTASLSRGHAIRSGVAVKF